MCSDTIVYLGGFELPDKNAAAHRVVSNSMIMNRLGYDIVFVGMSKVNKEVLFKGHQQILSLKYDSWEIPYPRSIYQWIKYLLNSRISINIVKQQKNIKFIILYNYPVLPTIKLLNYSRKNNISIISDITEWYKYKNILSVKNFISNIDSYLRMRIFNKKVDGLILISRLLYDNYDNIEKILIPPLEYISQQIEHRLDKDNNGQIIFTYFGSPGKKDNIDLIIDIFSRRITRTNYILNVIGIDKESFIRDYRFSNKYIDNNIRFLGKISHHDTLQIVSNSDFTIFFRKNDLVNNAGFPTKLVESFACGIPVITNNTSNISDFLHDGYNGFIIDEWNPTYFIEVINHVLCMRKNEINEMKSRTFKSNKFYFSNYEDNLKLFLERIVKK